MKLFSCSFFVFGVALSLCLVDSVRGNLGDFFSNLPTEIGNAFTTAWTVVKEAIKRPVRIKRLGSLGKRKSTTTTITTMITEGIKNTEISALLMMISTTGSPKLEIPVLPESKWRSRDQWRNFQLNNIVMFRKSVIEKERKLSARSEDEVFEGTSIESQTTAVKEDEDDSFGVLSFI